MIAFRSHIKADTDFAARYSELVSQSSDVHKTHAELMYY